MLLLRTLHLYLGMFFAPTIIFFAISGALQTLGLHEAEDATSVKPPRWIATIASLHKEQHLPHQKQQKMPGALSDMRAEHERNGHHERGGGTDAGTASDNAAVGSSGTITDRGQTLLKAFVVMMAAGLSATAGLGICIAINNSRTRRAASLMLALGIFVPAAMLLL